MNATMHRTIAGLLLGAVLMLAAPAAHANPRRVTLVHSSTSYRHPSEDKILTVGTIKFKGPKSDRQRITQELMSSAARAGLNAKASYNWLTRRQTVKIIAPDDGGLASVKLDQLMKEAPSLVQNQRIGHYGRSL
jgi:hypothetical protein